MTKSYGSNAPQDPAVRRQGSNHVDRFNIWLADLESIRRERPVVSSSLFSTRRVLQQAPPTTGPGPARKGGNTGPEVVVLDDDGGNGNDGGAAVHGGSPAQAQAFYGLQGLSPGRAGDMLRYQDQSLGWQGKYPTRQNRLGFNMVQLRYNKLWVSPVRTVQDVQPVWDHGMFIQHPPLGFDEAVNVNWARGSSPESLLFGFPMLGDVVMYRAMNYGGARSACFFKALAYLVYGD